MALFSFVRFLSILLFSFGQKDPSQVIFGPSEPNDINVWEEWINDITLQRKKDLEQINYNGSIYNVNSLKWTQNTFIQPQVMGWDNYLYDINSHSYTYDKWLNDVTMRYGGVDSLLFWLTYPNLGADDRNQVDLQLAIPGGLDALQNMVNYFHSQNPAIKVLFPYTPWDSGTRYYGLPDYQMMAQFLNETGADGFNGDTMSSVPQDFYTYSVDNYDHPIAICPEWGGDLESMNFDTLDWGYWPSSNYTPNVGKWKWYDGRYMTNICQRWAKNHTNDLQNAFFNGVGFESWENIFGVWNGLSERDAEIVRRISTILRYFGNISNNGSEFIQSKEWLPYVPIIGEKEYWNDLFASSFIINKDTNKQEILYLIINRNKIDINNALISINNTFDININDLHVFDCYYGIELNFTYNAINNMINFNINIEAIGYSAVLVTMYSRNTNKNLNNYLIEMNKLTQKPLKSYNTSWKYLQQTMKIINKTKLYESPPDNMIEIPWGIFYLVNYGNDGSGGNNTNGIDVQFIFETMARWDHKQYMTLDKFYIDKFPVTCSEYKKYLNESEYIPKDKHNYLKNWVYNNNTNEYNYPSGYEKKPVTYLGLNEARLYCNFYGKRLPHTYEWQYSGQGNTSYNYPWGNDLNMGTNCPVTYHGRTIPGPENVDAYVPQGNSLFGVSDLIGNIWQFTDEFSDNHTRSVIVRGQSNYRPSGSVFYFPYAYELYKHNRYFLMDNSYERVGTIGFRCAADAIQPSKGSPMFWYGKGNYCFGDLKSNGLLCGVIHTGKGYNDLTEEGNLDWVQFGINYNDNSPFKLLRKKSNNSIEYINNITTTSKNVYLFSSTPRPRAFYWNDGNSQNNNINVLNKNNASMAGVFIDHGQFSFSVNHLIGGNIYQLRIFVGVYSEQGLFNTALIIDGKESEMFEDNTIYEPNDDTTNACYVLVIDLSSIDSTNIIQLLVNWIVNKGGGNITFQAIALKLL